MSNKKNNTMKTKKLLLSLLALFASIGANAYSFKVNGIYYNILSSSEKTVAVSYMAESWFDPDEGESAPAGFDYETQYWESDDDCGTYYYYYYSDYSGSITIPSSITYNGSTYQVVRIGEYAFCNCLSVTSITIPNSVTTIEANAFKNCPNLTKAGFASVEYAPMM